VIHAIDARHPRRVRRSEFVCFVTEEAAGRCAEEKRKTINGDDLIFALQNLGFEEYVPPLQSYLAQYRRVSKQKEKE
jgi:nuclear transcription Y subunit beta